MLVVLVGLVSCNAICLDARVGLLLHPQPWWLSHLLAERGLLLAGFCRFLKFSLAMAFGNVFIYSLQRYYGALVVTTTTTLRKFLSGMSSHTLCIPPIALLPLLAEKHAPAEHGALSSCG